MKKKNDRNRPIELGSPNDDNSLEMDGTNIGSCSTPRRQELSPMNMQIGSSETMGLINKYTKQEVEMLLKDRFKGDKFDWKKQREWMNQYIKRMKECVHWFQKSFDDVVEENDGLRKMLELARRNCSETETALKRKEEEFKATVSKLETNILSLNKSLSKQESEKKTYTKEEVEMLLKEKFKGKKFDRKGKKEWIIQYVKRLKVCLNVLEGGFDEKDGLRKMLPSSEIINNSDPFSLLPDDIFDIMSRINCTTKELIRTSIISKRWQNLWALVPHLIFLKHQDEVYKKTYIKPYNSFIDNTINQCPMYPNLKKFKIDTEYDSLCLCNREFKSQVNDWIHYAISRDVEEFDLGFWDIGEGREFTYDDDLFFSSSCVTRIKLNLCRFDPPNGVISWQRLASLCIYAGTLDEDMLQKILSGSPCLETLELQNCYGYRLINVNSKSVKKLVFSGYNSNDQIDRDDEDYIDCIKVNAPYISSLTIEGYLLLRELALLDVSFLVEADLDYWSEESHEEIFRGLLESLKHVKNKAFGDQFSELLSRLEASSDTSNDDAVDQEEESD